MHNSAATAQGGRFLAFQFRSLDEQHESATLGMWIFLATEILFFGGLFTGYLVYRNLYHQAWADASTKGMWFAAGTTNTAVLICSSLTMALAVHAAQTGMRKLLVLFLIVTMLLGCTFLVIKGFEYHKEYVEHHVPGPQFQFPESSDPRHAELFFALYFIMTGLHTLHMIIGVGVMAVITYFAWRGHYAPEYYNPVENAGLYWHFVDVIWIFLYPLLYLVTQ
jgi:cytochrome c oxidase subunit 3